MNSKAKDWASRDEMARLTLMHMDLMDRFIILSPRPKRSAVMRMLTRMLEFLFLRDWRLISGGR